MSHEHILNVQLWIFLAIDSNVDPLGKESIGVTTFAAERNGCNIHVKREDDFKRAGLARISCR